MKQEANALLSKISKGVNSVDEAHALLAECFNVISEMLEQIPDDRTEKQSSSRWIYLSVIARQLNDAGFDRQRVLTMIKESAGVNAQNTRETLYLDYWRPVHDALYPEVKRLDTKQIQCVYESMNEHCGRVFGISAAWPDRFNAGN